MSNTQYEVVACIDSTNNGALVTTASPTVQAYLLATDATHAGATIAQVGSTGFYKVSYDPVANGEAWVLVDFGNFLAGVGGTALAGDRYQKVMFKKDPVAQGFIPSYAGGAQYGLMINGSNSGAVTFGNGVTITTAAGSALTLSGGTGGSGLIISGYTSTVKINAPSTSGAGIEIHGYNDFSTTTASAIFCASNNAPAAKFIVGTGTSHGVHCQSLGLNQGGLYCSGAYGTYNNGTSVALYN